MARGATVTELPVERDPFDFPPNTNEVKYMGVTYRFRELTVAETDQAREDATIGEQFDGRLMTRLMIATSAVEPKMAVDDIAKLPQRLYAAIVDIVNDLNDPDALAKAEDDPGKS